MVVDLTVRYSSHVFGVGGSLVGPPSISMVTKLWLLPSIQIKVMVDHAISLIEFPCLREPRRYVCVG